jgi:lipopolysaccharide O-acetyltransferase
MSYSQYTLLNKFKLIICVIYTKLFYSKSRLIRLPFDVRNKKNIYWGNNLTTGVNCRIETYSEKKDKIVLFFGDNVQINDYVHIAAMDHVKIGNDVLIASKVYISDINHGKYSGNLQDSPYTQPSSRKLHSKSVIIENNVWIGENVCIMPGVNIGYGSIIGAGSVVTKSIPCKSIAVGVPATVIKKYDDNIKMWTNIK